MHRGRNVARKKEFNFLFSVYLCACSVVLCVINEVRRTRKVQSSRFQVPGSKSQVKSYGEKLGSKGFHRGAQRSTEMHRGRNVTWKKEFNFLFSVYLCACSVVLCVINTGMPADYRFNS